MGSPLTLTQVTRTADVLDAQRVCVKFPPLPGGAEELTGDGPTTVAGGEGLTVRKAEIILPQIALGQVRAALLGGVKAFRGNFVDHQNQFTMAFWEDSRGATWQALWRWFRFCQTNKYDDYVVDLDVEWYDTKGVAVLPSKIWGTWPLALTPAPSSEETQPMRHTVQFSMTDITYFGEDY